MGNVADSNRVKILIPPFREKGTYDPVKCYFLWSIRDGAYADALAQRIEKDKFRILFTKSEMARLCHSIYGKDTGRTDLAIKELLYGRLLRNDVRGEHPAFWKPKC